ncbi:MAG TPA: cation:proton antiporter, partial [Longimicrobiales bacterium]|nr:cation:proton antiporter [Longimicrobiales bacterium]
GLTWLSYQGLPPTLEGGRLSVLLGFVLLTSSLSGVLAAEAGLPKITGYIVVGIVAGPSLLGLLPARSVTDLSLIDDFALALIAMLAGGELQVGHLKPQARSIAVTTLTVTVVVWVGMALAVLAVRPLVPFLAELSWTGAAGVALLLGVWAANSSPDLTVAVIEERAAKGPLAEVILGVTIVKDVVVIVLFTLTLTLVTPLLDPSQAFSAHALVDLAREVGGALVVGAAGGWVFSQYLGKEGDTPRSPMATFIFAYMMVVVAAELHVELLLAGVAAGFVIENLSPAGDRMIQGIRSVAVVIFAFFFTIAGAGLDLGSVLRFGPAAVVLFLARVFLTRWGARQGLRWAGADDDIRTRVWLGLISQGGVSLGLVLLIRDAFPGVGAGVVALAMALIIGNILGGPILLGRALASPGAEAGGKA